MKSFLLTTIIFFACLIVHGQISHGGYPYDWDQKESYNPVREVLPKPDLDSYKSEDKINDGLSGIPYRFGANIPVDLDIFNSGEWTELENGDGVWRLMLVSKNAKSLNFVFDAYDIPEGAKVFVYTPDKSKLLGSFTRENASKLGSLGVGLIISDRIVVEYHEPAAVRGLGYLHINNVTHGYRDVLVEVETEEKGAFGNSGACNINVNCPEGLPFDIQKRSVALIVVNNNSLCSGALVNNVAQDGTPFFLTARHCTPGSASGVSNWVFYFNHESAGCSGNNGPTNQSVSGSTLLARNQESDFALLELDDAPPPSFNVCYSGWDATDDPDAVSSAYGIHHPSGDIKKICFEEDAPYFQNIGSFVNQTWYIDEWELGVTEGGSSGSPLFNQNGLIIGQLAGGTAACSGTVNNGLPDFYGRLGVSWDFGGTPTNSLGIWLDPGNTGTLIIPNSCNSSQPDNNASLGQISGVEAVQCSLNDITPSVNVFNLGGNPITEIVLEVTFNGNSSNVEWSGDLDFGESVFISLGSFSPIEGDNSIEVEVSSVNGVTDSDETGNNASRDFIAFSNGASATVSIDFDDYPEETSWEITDLSGNVLYSGGPYSEDATSTEEEVCLGLDCYLFTIFDSYGDGICCGFGLGSYEVLDGNGNVLASGGQFEDDDTNEICLVLGTEDENRNALSLYPNPAQNEFTVSAGNTDLQSVRLFDVQGREVLVRQNIQSNLVTLDTESLGTGIYVTVITTDQGTIREKLMIER